MRLICAGKFFFNMKHRNIQKRVFRSFFRRSSPCNTDVFWKNHRIDSVSLFSAEWFICPVLWKMVPQVWNSVCNVRAFRNSFHIKNDTDLCVIIQLTDHLDESDRSIEKNHYEQVVPSSEDGRKTSGEQI